MSGSTPPDVFVHDKALCESVRVGARTRVWPFAHIMAGAVVGSDCNLGEHSFIEAGAVVGDRVTVKNGVAIWAGITVEDDVFIGPFAVFTNDPNPRASFKKDQTELVPTTVRAGSTIGANSTIICGVQIGESAFVAAGAVVTRTLPAHALVVGSPARWQGWMCTCGNQLDASLACSCGRRYRPRAGAEPGGLIEIVR